MRRLAICLQFYSGDRVRAMEVARLIAANETKFRDDVLFCFVNRFDTPAADQVAMDEIGMKMKYCTFRTTTQANGWPAGPNAMAIDTLRHAEWQAKYGTWHDVDGVLLMEPDCIPIRRDWISELKAEWKHAYEAGKWIMGTWRDGGGELGHINGNCITVPGFASLVDFNKIPVWLAWDCALSEQLHEHWEVTHLICNRWQETALTDETICEHRDAGYHTPPCLLHGVKDDSALNYAERMLLS